jgi:hypothetical protein
MDAVKNLKEAVELKKLNDAASLLSSCSYHQNYLHGLLRQEVINKNYQMCELLLNYGACPFFDPLSGYGGTTVFELAALTEDSEMICLFTKYSSRWDAYKVYTILQRIYKKTPKYLKIIVEIFMQQQVRKEFYETYINIDYENLIQSIQSFHL